jgi:hypothetical protein
VTVQTSAPSVVVITHCRKLELLRGGTLLVFGSLRTGFPTADVTVVDNGSLREARGEIRAAAESVGARYVQLESTNHEDTLGWCIERARGSLVFVDPDIMFWERCEDWDFGDALLVGRYIPGFFADDRQLRAHALPPATEMLYVQPRLHPSFLWLPSVEEFRSWLAAFRTEHPGFSAIRSGNRPMPETGGRVWMWAEAFCMGSLALGSRARAFTAKHLDCYDHLFVGSHIDLMPSAKDPIGFEVLERHATAASGDPERIRGLRGIWRRQQALFDIGRLDSQRVFGSPEEEPVYVT